VEILLKRDGETQAVPFDAGPAEGLDDDDPGADE
jgi:hypothetical protein